MAEMCSVGEAKFVTCCSEVFVFPMLYDTEDALGRRMGVELRFMLITLELDE